MSKMTKEQTIEKYQYLIGQKINKWTVLEIKFDRKKPDALCECECGTIKLVNLQNLLHNLSKDCGCGRKKTLSDRQTDDIIGQKFGRLTVLELLPERNKNKRKIYKCQCECGNIVNVLGNSLKTYHTLSCGCLNSYYNAYIDQLLTEKSINHIKEFHVPINGVNYSYDFYLPEHNLFIEYDGIQHFEPVRFFRTKEKNIEAFKKQQLRDQIKNKYCVDNSINLLRIPYWESKNIDLIIDNCLERLSKEGTFMCMQQSGLQL